VQRHLAPSKPRIRLKPERDSLALVARVEVLPMRIPSPAHALAPGVGFLGARNSKILAFFPRCSAGDLPSRLSPTRVL